MANKKIPGVVFLLLLATAAFWAYQQFSSGTAPDTHAVRVSGNIEVVDAELSFKLAGRVTERLVTEGDLVKLGQLVARLEDREYVQEVDRRTAEMKQTGARLKELLAGYRWEEVAQAKAGVDRTRSRLDELLAGSRPQEIAAAQAETEHARADMENLQREYRRQADLLKEGVTSQEQHDAAKTRFELAVARLKQATETMSLVKEGPRKEAIDQARATLDEAEKKHTQLKAGPRKEEIDQARAALEQTKAALALAQTRLQYTLLTSPINGVVLSKNIEPGEYVSAGTPVVTAADLNDIWLRAYINETDLGRVKLGQHARVTTDTFPGKIYEGKITFIASEAEFTPKNVQTEKERVKLVYRVKITLSNPQSELKPGMPADAEILLGPS
jgi:HlyD family secretion protein